MNEFEIVVKTSKGLEDVLEKEIKNLTDKPLNKINRGFTLKGNMHDVYVLNYNLRTAVSILKPIHSFYINSIDDLYHKCKAIAWEDIFDVKKTFSIEHAINSPLVNHTQFAALRVKDAIADRFMKLFEKRPNVERHQPDFIINVHISNNQCNISLNTSGDSLFKRGYKREHGEASIKENLAAGMILLSEWNGTTPLLDPFCGSGTILTEAAMIAMRIPAGYFRTFGFEKWKDFDKNLWDEVKEKFNKEIRDNPTEILGYDMERESTTIASKNLELFRGMNHGIKIRTKNFFEIEKPFAQGTIITNPPYDVRMKIDHVEEFYGKIGSKLKHCFTGYYAWIISSSKNSLKKIGMKYTKKYLLLNSKLECEFVNFIIYEGSLKPKKA
ncbi:MAG: class I SAM-dependent RNA methyltransferase [Bacteroidia bacterium]